MSISELMHRPEVVYSLQYQSQCSWHLLSTHRPVSDWLNPAEPLLASSRIIGQPTGCQLPCHNLALVSPLLNLAVTAVSTVEEVHQSLHHLRRLAAATVFGSLQ